MTDCDLREGLLPWQHVFSGSKTTMKWVGHDAIELNSDQWEYVLFSGVRDQSLITGKGRGAGGAYEMEKYRYETSPLPFS